MNDCEHIQQQCRYDFNCLPCCSRLVIAARPSRKHQEGMLMAIDRFRGKVNREDVLNHLRKAKKMNKLFP